MADQTFIPNVSAGQTSEELPPRQWDPRLDARGVTVETPSLSPGEKFWRAINVQWLDKEQSQGRHAIYGNVYVDGVLQAGIPVLIEWPSDMTTVQTEDKSRDYPPFNYWYNYPMSPSLNEFSVSVFENTPSEVVRGIGMGFNGNSREHTSTVVEWELVTMPGENTAPPEGEVGEGPSIPPTDPEEKKLLATISLYDDGSYELVREE